MKTCYRDAKLYNFVRPIVRFLFFRLYRPTIKGTENIPENGPIILAGNHTNNFDCLLLMSSTKRCIHFLAKNELWKGPKKLLFANMGLIPVERKSKDHFALKEAKGYLENGKVIGIFPEGTTEKDKGVLLPFKMGAIKLAKDTNVSIVPFAINGDYKLFSNNLCVTFGKKITVKSDNLEKEKERLCAKVKALMVGEK